MKSMNNKKKEYNKVFCRCKSKNIKRDGKRKTLNRGLIQRYKCKNCNKRFVVDNGFFRMRNSEKKITLCLDLFFRGISTRKIEEHLQFFYAQNSSWVTVYSWIVKYSNMIHKFTDKLQVKTGEELMSDEMEYHRLGKQNWFVDVMDTNTRYMVSSDYMIGRTLENMTKVLVNAKKKTGSQIKTVTTDGLRGYSRVLKRSFGLKTHWNHKSPIKHNIVIASKRGFNHKIERLHNSIRERTKTMRGFHGSLESASSIMKGYEIYYNFIRRHQAINKRPYEIATDLKLGKNGWLDLIKMSRD